MSFHHVMLLSLGMLSLAANGAQGGGPDNAGFANCDFEQGVAGWKVWYSDDRNAVMTRYPYTADNTVAHGGRQSLKIVAPDENGLAFVMRDSAAIKPGARYEVGYWFRKTPELEEGTFHVQFNLRPVDKAKSNWRTKSVQLQPTRRKAEGEWQYRAGYVLVPKDASPSASMGLYLKGARGTIWIDDLQIREVKVGENMVADLWAYDPHRVELGGEPLKRFSALQDRNDPILARAARYNATLVKSAFVKEEVRRCLRIRSSCTEADKLGARMVEAEERLAKAYRAYGEAFFDSSNTAKAEVADKQLVALNVELESLGGDARRAIAAATERCRSSGRQWDPPPAPLASALPAITGDGRVNQILYANRSLWKFQQLERPLGFDPIHSTNVGRPTSDQPGRYDWSKYEEEWKSIRESGIPKKSCLLLFMVLHDGSWAPKWLLDRAKDDPEILHVVRPEAKLAKRATGSVQINWWHPAVRDYAREIVSDMGRAFRSRDDFLFYEFQWEAAGPIVSTEKGYREVGYGKYAEADFHAWLNKKYGDIASLNRRWSASYASFDDIQPPADSFVVERRRAEPLAAEWEAWRAASYEDWCRLIYRAWKDADPSKPVMADNSGLLRRFNMPNLADTCDMMSCHIGGRLFMPTLMLLNSISRHNGFKPLAQYENFWGTQEDHDRIYEELPRRHGTQKHIFRMTVWNMFLQVWWYSYTTAEYLTQYDGNYFDPTYSLTTLRYRTAALPVYFQKFKRLQSTLLDSRIVAPRICMLAPSASMRNNFPTTVSQTEIFDLFWELYPRNYHFDLVYDDYFLDGRAKLDDFDVLILPYAAYLDDRLQDAIEKWLHQKQRLLVTAGPFGLYDEIGRDSGKLPSATFPGRSLQLDPANKTGWQWTTDPANSGDMLESRVGPSHAVALLKPVSQLKTQAGLIEGLVQRIEDVTGRPAWDDKNALEIVLRQQDAARYLCVLNPNQDEAAESVVRVKGRFSFVTDLDYERGFPIASRIEAGCTVFPLRLEPGEATIIRLSDGAGK